MPSLFVADNNTLNRRWQFMQFAAREAGVAKHLFEFGKCVSIASRGRTQHHHAEGGGLRRRDAIFVRNEFQRDRAAAVFQSRMDLTQQRFTSRRIEVMQKVCEQHDVIVGSVINVEGAAGYRVVASRSAKE